MAGLNLSIVEPSCCTFQVEAGALQPEADEDIHGAITAQQAASSTHRWVFRGLGFTGLLLIGASTLVLFPSAARNESTSGAVLYFKIPAAPKLGGHRQGDHKTLPVIQMSSDAVTSDAAVRPSRRDLLRGAASVAATLPVIARSLPAVAAQGGVPEGMKTSESYSNLQQIAPEITGTLGAGTMSSRSRPDTGVVLLEQAQDSGKKDAPTVSAELVLDGGVAATATFQAEPGYPLVSGMFYDVECKGKQGDSVFLQVARLPEGKEIKDVADGFFTKSVFATGGRFGAYGAATGIKVLSEEAKGKVRLFDVAFSALSPSMLEVPRHALVAAVQPEGSTDVVMLVGSSAASSWKKVQPSMRNMMSSFNIARVRSTQLARKAKNDYRFQERGGFQEKAGDSNGVPLSDIF